MLTPCIRYGAQRANDMTEAERCAVQRIVEKYAVNANFSADPADGPDWDEFGVESAEKLQDSGFIFRGATQLPGNSGDHMWQGLVQWCRALTEIRRTLGGCSWYCNVDDHHVAWNERTSEYVPDPYAAFLVADPVATATAFAEAMSRVGFGLDFSIASLRSEVEKVMRSDFMPDKLLSATLPKRHLMWVRFVRGLQRLVRDRLDMGLCEKEKARNAAALYAYIGEVMRRLYDGRWMGVFHPNAPELNRYHSLVVFDDGTPPFQPYFFIDAHCDQGMSFQVLVAVTIQNNLAARKNS